MRACSAALTATISTPSVRRSTEIPLAERWGEYGAGARPGGYGDAPDPAEFGDVPVGEDQRAHPLNPSGTSGAAAPYDVPGYTTRGTPIPPGFYNLAYYQRYLREGGTPLEGFPGWEPEDTGYENIVNCGLFLGMTPQEIERKTPEIAEVCGLGSYLDIPVRTYSAGMTLRLAFSIASVEKTRSMQARSALPHLALSHLLRPA